MSKQDPPITKTLLQLTYDLYDKAIMKEREASENSIFARWQKSKTYNPPTAQPGDSSMLPLGRKPLIDETPLDRHNRIQNLYRHPRRKWEMLEALSNLNRGQTTASANQPTTESNR